MHLHFELALLAFTGLVHSVPLQGVSVAGKSVQRRAVDHKSLEGITKLKVDMSGADQDDPGKYFHESSFHPHYDGRFTKTILPPKLQLFHLRFLLSSYLQTLESLKVETWIMHGSLLGWWWNQRIMPWDTDLDVQVDERGIRFLAEWHNMTVHSFTRTEIGLPPTKPEDIHETEYEKVRKNGKTFLLEINPHYLNDSEEDDLNMIDARWIDVDTGLFIDITALRSSHNPANLEEMRCKDKHHYLGSQIFPLRVSELEGVPVRIPYAYKELLEEEYGKTSLTETYYNGYEFDEEKKEWLKYVGPGSVAQHQLQEDERRQRQKQKERWEAQQAAAKEEQEDKNDVWWS